MARSSISLEYMKNYEQISKFLNNSSTPEWAREIVKTAMMKDVVEAANVLDTLAQLFATRCDEIVEAGKLS